MIIKRSNNHGMSSIVFAIAFVTILSLLAVGFATIARRDTNEVLDRTLSYQAQYAAESGINKAIKQIKAGTTSQTDCTNPSASFTLSPGVDITCVTWGSADDNNVVLSGIKEYPKNIRLQSADQNKSIDKINIEWSYADAVGRTPNGIKPSIDGKNILKIALAKPGVQTNNLMYANATTSGSTAVDLQDGASFDVNCTGNSCSLDINSLGGNTWFLALSSLGKDVSRATITAYNGSNQLNLADVQIEIDSNAIANGVTKRLLARVPLESSSWIPANAVTANRICKDIRIDGDNNNTNISGYNYPNSPPNPDTGPLIGCPNGSVPTGSSGSAEVYPPATGGPPSTLCTDPAKDIVIVMDYSNSMINNVYTSSLGELRSVVQAQSVQEFINTINLTDTGNKLSIVKFNNDGQVRANLTTNKAVLSNAVNSLMSFDPATHYVDGLTSANSALYGSGNRAGATKIIVFLSDGRANDLGEGTPAQRVATYNHVINYVNSSLGITNIYPIAVDYSTNFTDILPNMYRGNGTFYDASSAQSLIDRLGYLADLFNCN